MQFGHFLKRCDNMLTAERVVTNERLDFAGFQKVYPGRLATNEEIKSARVASAC